MLWRRLFGTSSIRWASPQKSLLAKLRKSTGYTFAKCKEALEKHNNDVSEAEKWLHRQAQAHGWDKATKLQGRSTTQGLVAICLDPSSSSAAMVEVNCETDFVSRNLKFQSFAAQVAQGCLDYAVREVAAPSSHLGLAKISLRGEEIGSVRTANRDRTITEDMVLRIGELGENISLRRAVCVKASPKVLLSGYTHPSESLQVGKYGSLVAYSKLAASSSGGEAEERDSFPQQLPLHEVGRQLCQHVVGMNPSSLGDLEEAAASEEEGGEEQEDQGKMLLQEFLLEPEMTVRDFLQQSGVAMIDFVRFECGETAEEKE